MSNQDTRNNSLLESNHIMSSIIGISLPMMITGLLDALYNMVDSIFVGRFVGEKALAALAINNTIQIFLLALSVLYGAGMVSIVSRGLGAKNYAKVNDTIVNGIALCFLTTSIVSLSILFNLDHVLMFLGSSIETLPYSRQYGQVILWFGFLVPTNGVLMGILRSRGEVKTIMKLAFLGAISNIVLDAIFIIGFGWGVAGAAWATISAQFIVTIILFKTIMDIYQIHFELHYLKKMSWSLVSEIYSIGISNFLRVATFAIMGMQANKTLSSYGTEALAAFGIVNRILHLAYQPIFGSNLGTQALIGYNYGANRFLKVKEIIIKAILFATGLGIVPSILFVWAPKELFELFTKSPEIIAYTQDASRIAGITFFLYGIQISSSGALIAMGHPKEALILSVIRPSIMVFGVSILPKFIGITGVWAIFPFTDIISTIITVVFMSKELSALKKREQCMKDLLYKPS